MLAYRRVLWDCSRISNHPLDAVAAAAEGGNMICLVQLLYYEASLYMKKPKMLKCKECPFMEKCEDEAKEEK